MGGPTSKIKKSTQNMSIMFQYNIVSHDDSNMKETSVECCRPSVKSAHMSLGAVLSICVINRRGFAKPAADDLFKVCLNLTTGISA